MQQSGNFMREHFSSCEFSPTNSQINWVHKARTESCQRGKQSVQGKNNKTGKIDIGNWAKQQKD
jgi:hypothetical protein